MVKKLFLAVFLSILGQSLLLADQVAVTTFKGLNNNNNSAKIDSSQAQDLLNVDIPPGGLSVKKRSGYGLYKALSSGPVHGGYHAFNSSGNDYQLWGSSKTLYGIVSDGVPTVLVSSATLNSIWDCADTQGSSYCVDSNRDAYIKTAGASITWYTSPLGTMVEATPDRVVVAGVSGSPNTLYVSQSNTFTNFVTGVLPTDAFTEVIAAPGSKITHIRWGCGKLLWWKDASFGYFDFDNQYTAQIKTVSDIIGTFDNTSAIDPGGRVWFRGQDGHTWMYDCSALTKESVDITPTVQLSGKRISNSWTQSSQADFETGSIVPTGRLSTTISPGDVIVSSFVVTENTQSQWNLGSNNNTTNSNSNYIYLNTNNLGSPTNPDFEAAFSGNWTDSGSSVWSRSGTVSATGCTLNPQSGSWFAIGTVASNPITSASFEVIDANTSSVLNSAAATISNNCSWNPITVAVGSLTGKRIKVRFHAISSSTNYYLTSSDSYIWGGDITGYFTSATRTGVPTLYFAAFDNIQNGSSTIATGSFTSRTFDTGFSSSTIQISSFNVSTNGVTGNVAPSIDLWTSTSATGPFTEILTTTSVNASANQYVRYSSTITATGGAGATYGTVIQTVQLLAQSTGTYYSAVKNAPNITAWSTLGVNEILNSGTETFYLRSSTNSFTVLSSTPSWTSQTIGGLITISTGTYFQLRDDFAVTAATQTPTLNDFTINWFEGSAADQVYMLYFDNAIWESVAYGAGQSINNYIFKYDLINDLWTLYNFGAGGMAVQANTLYFGDTSSGNVYNFGTATSDNGTAIQAYWKSKDFTGADPFLQNQLTQIDTFAKKNQGTTLTSTYTLDTSTSTTGYSIDLSSTTRTIVQNRKLLPPGKLGYTFNIQYGDTSASSAWELLGFRIGYLQQPYRVSQ